MSLREEQRRRIAALALCCLSACACARPSSALRQPASAESSETQLRADAAPTAEAFAAVADRRGLVHEGLSRWVLAPELRLAFELPAEWYLWSQHPPHHDDTRADESIGEASERTQRTHQVWAGKRPQGLAQGLSPTLQARLRDLPSPLPVAEACAATRSQLSRDLQERVTLVRHEVVDVGGYPAARCVFRFRVTTEDGARALESDMLLLPRGRQLLQVSVNGAAPLHPLPMQRLIEAFRAY